MRNAMQRIFPNSGGVVDTVSIGLMLFTVFTVGVMRSRDKQSDSETRLSKRDLTAQGLIGLSASLFLLYGSAKVSDVAQNTNMKNIVDVTYGVVGTLLSPVSFTYGTYLLGEGTMDLYQANAYKSS